MRVSNLINYSFALVNFPDARREGFPLDLRVMKIG